MITGISMALETHLMLGQVSHNLLYSTKKLPTDICGPGEIHEKTAYIQARSSMARAMEVNGKAREAERRSKSGLKKSSILTTHENCEDFISSTPRIRNSRKPSRTHVRNWKRQWLRLCPVKLQKKIVGVVHPTKLRQNLRGFLKLMNPQECVWEIRYRRITKTILQER